MVMKMIVIAKNNISNANKANEDYLLTLWLLGQCRYHISQAEKKIRLNFIPQRTQNWFTKLTLLDTYFWYREKTICDHACWKLVVVETLAVRNFFWWETFPDWPEFGWIWIWIIPTDGLTSNEVVCTKELSEVILIKLPFEHLRSFW